MHLLAIGHSYVLAVNRAILRSLARDNGFAVTVAAPEQFQGDYGSIRLQPEASDSPLHLVGLPVRWTRSPHLFHYRGRALTRLLKEGAFNVVSIWEEPYTLSAWLIVRAVRRFAPGARICFYSCQNLSKRYPPPFSWFERQTVRSSDGWQASGELVYQVLTGRGYDPSKGKVLALAVDTSLFQPLSWDARRATLASLGIQPPVIGFLGRLAPQKGIRVLLEALEIIPGDQEWSALFLGSGPEQKTIEDWADARGWQQRVRVQLVRHEEVPRYLGVMDVLAAPSQTTPRWKEQFGRMLIEAFACGVPVIGSDSGEIPNVIGDAGIVVPEADPVRWAAELAALLVDAKRRSELAQRGLARAQEFSAASLANRYDAFYRSFLHPVSSGTGAAMSGD